MFLKVGAAPAIDRLVGIADHAQIPMALGEKLDQVVLRAIGVLILVHHDEAELGGIAVAQVGHGVEQLHGLEEQVVEVERAVVFEALDVFFVHLHELLAALAPAARPEKIGPRHGVLRVADLRQRLPRLHEAVVDLQVLEHLLDERQLIGRVVDDEVAGQTDGGGLAAEKARAQRMERRHPRARRAERRCGEERLDPSTHFFRCLVGEGDGKNFIGLGVAFRNQVGNPLGDDAGLARAGAGQNEQRPVDVQDGVALFGIQG